MKELIERMNSILSDWKSKFEVAGDVQMEFSTDSEGSLCLNEHPIHMPAGLDLSYAEFNAEHVRFCFEGTRKVLVIGIKWPEDAVPEVDVARFGYESEV